MPDADRERLVALCTEYHVRIVADDVYETLRWTHQTPARPDSVGDGGGGGGGAVRSMRWHAQQQGAESTVVSLGSWSKILGPGLRLGWIEAGE